jgi:hypothetical protein
LQFLLLLFLFKFGFLLFVLYFGYYVVNHCVHFDVFPVAKSDRLKDESSGYIREDYLFGYEVLFSLKVKFTFKTFNILVSILFRFA